MPQIMKQYFLLVMTLGFSYMSYGQYDPGVTNYGLTMAKNLGLENEVSGGVRIEYAYNCFTTYIGEFNRSFAVSPEDVYEGYNELAFGVNIIAFNWYPTTITAGMGYIGNDSSVFESIEDEAFLAFRTGDFNHGAQIKLRALYQVNSPIHIFTELNIKSLGRRYDTFLIGFSYDFNAR